MVGLQASVLGSLLGAVLFCLATAAPPYMPEEEIEYLPYGGRDVNNAEAAYEDYVERLLELNQARQEAREYPQYQQYEEQSYYMKEPEPEVTPLPEEAADWPAAYVTLNVGQIGGVAVCEDGDAHVFHRAHRVWEENTFDANHSYTGRDKGPIPEDTLLILERFDGKVKKRLGAKKFYFPHGITKDGPYYWLTDVATHQVYKYDVEGDDIVMELGKKFEPAQTLDDKERFCQPTDVAVTSEGDIFISDGYCGSRVVKMDANGTYITQFGTGQFNIPHSIALVEDRGWICVADRNQRPKSRIACYDAGLDDPSRLGELELERTILNPNELVYALSYNTKNRQLYAVTEESMGEDSTSHAYAIDLDTDDVEEWTPESSDFTQAHDIDVGPSGDVAYVGLTAPDAAKKVWKFDVPL